MQVWTVANQKGGVGKTTTTVSLGGLAAEQGLRVLVVDLDPHGSLTSYFGHDPDWMDHSSFTLFQNIKTVTRSKVMELVCPTPFDHLHLLPASASLATLERQAISKDGMGLVIRKALASVAESYDLAIIDCPPQLGVLLINALAACEKLLIPVQTEFLALKGLERMLHTLSMLQRSRSSELPYLIVPTMFDRRTQASISSLRALRNGYGENVWPGKISVDTRFRDASKAGIPPHLFAPESRGVEGYRSLLNYCGLNTVAQRRHASLS